ncbi:DNA cytosine methyltransferase [Aeromicrobium fastidiosum]|uniref:DNA cytosine methyltransferase n=1 Tax=Aeromicrobium fastidiosum TaxID=52699 RepID=UPI002023628D|nr:DNA cytosine methyltransferase [Aeromicrobium fastidiosum]MCL8251354.1 DNA cytosine methyltransferase [Aeromicrobium fastidiosum]
MSEGSAFLKKIERLERGEAPRLVDLFSGCGGITLGMERAGFRSLAGVEIDEHAARTYANNFHTGSVGVAHDITTLDPAHLLGVSSGAVDGLVDAVMGGPPCPSFTRVGRAKLREVMDHPEAFKLDPRTTLYLHAVRFIRDMKPLVVVIENVPDVLNQGGECVGETIAEQIESLGYDVTYSLLNSSNYGVPQFRDRFILVGFHKSLGVSPSLPTATHKAEIPRGYTSSRRVALRLVETLEVSHWSPVQFLGDGAQPAVTVGDAIRDLPPIYEHLHREQRRGAKRLQTPVSLPDQELGSYAHEMRYWPGFETDVVLAHETRELTQRDYRIFARMAAGDEYPAAHGIGMGLWKESGGLVANERMFVPPYDPSKFPNKWAKMDAARPARTLMAHLGKDSYSHIHYDSDQARTLTVREAARLQSFPDGFNFSGTMNPAFRQIGNAVPPLLAHALGEQIATDIGLRKGSDQVSSVAS